jgi:hypothetical protein
MAMSSKGLVCTILVLSANLIVKLMIICNVIAFIAYEPWLAKCYKTCFVRMWQLYTLWASRWLSGLAVCEPEGMPNVYAIFVLGFYRSDFFMTIEN